jgi:hypothetical protein
MLILGPNGDAVPACFRWGHAVEGAGGGRGQTETWPPPQPMPDAEPVELCTLCGEVVDSDCSLCRDIPRPLQESVI